MSKGEREITSKLNHISRGEISRGANTPGKSNLQGSQMLDVQEESCHMSSWGERHVHMCLFALALFICFFELCFSVPYLLPVSHARFRGSKTSKGRKSLNSLHIFTFGDMSISNVVLSTHSTCHPSLGTLVASFCLFWLVSASVLSNLIFTGSFHSKPTQDHKVSICITIMCMRNSC